jgi:hypothetical protein
MRTVWHQKSGFLGERDSLTYYKENSLNNSPIGPITFQQWRSAIRRLALDAQKVRTGLWSLFPELDFEVSIDDEMYIDIKATTPRLGEAAAFIEKALRTLQLTRRYRLEKITHGEWWLGEDTQRKE